MTYKTAVLTTLAALTVAIAGAVASIGPRDPGTRPANPKSGRLEGPPRITETETRAQTRGPLPSARPPALLVRPDESEPSAPLVLEQARYDVTVVGLSARTRATLVFRNDLGRVLDGELVFPLPEGALVSGFALDVGGRLVDGVVVPAQEARVAYETETRRRVDPGLVEWVRGNVFRTRVFPIPARGRRTVALEYISDLAISASEGHRQAIYELPLRFTAPVDELALKIQIVRGDVTPPVVSGLANFTFSRWEDRYVAETTQRGVQPGDDLRVALPDVPRENVGVETAGSGETFFVVDDAPTLPEGLAASRPDRIGIVWDASLSRQEADREREVALIAAHLRQLGIVEVEVVVFRHVADPPRLFSIVNGDATMLARYLREQPCDGATNLDGVAFPDRVAYTLLFSDGLATVASGATAAPTRPIHIVNGDPQADHARLRMVAQRTGGAYFNLQRETDATVLAQLGKPVFSLLAVEADPAAVADVEPAGIQDARGGRVRVAGRLLAPDARVTLRYGLPGQPATDSRTVVMRRGPSRRPSGLVERLWAQLRMSVLTADPEANRADLVRLGQRFSIVTPGTSLLVLETLDQYLEHDVTPPETSPELRAAFLDRRAQEGNLRTVKRTDKVARVVAMWERRVEHWSREFPDQVLPPVNAPAADQARDLPDAAVGGVGGRVANALPMPSAPVPATMPPPSVAAGAAPAEAPAAMRQSMRMAADSQSAHSSAGPAAGIVIQSWNPDTPYLRSLGAAPAGDAYGRYLAERGTYGRSPAFYLDCAGFFFERGERPLALRVLTSVAELKIDDARLMRVLAHRLEQAGELDLAIDLFERVLRLRPEEPQSPRDLALALDRRAGTRERTGGPLPADAATDYGRALSLLAGVVEGEWDARFSEVEVIALVEANRIQSLLERAGRARPWPLDARLRRLLDFDLRVVLTWDTDQTDMDLWVVEPTGERCLYSHPYTAIGGHLSKDFTGGYGPEEYSIRRAAGGDYAVKANFFGSQSLQLTGPTIVQATVITDYGRPSEQRRAITVRLASAREVVDIGQVAVAKRGKS